MLDFTGERVVPGLVDPDLLNEHLARYRLAARFAEGKTVLDAGCGSGYGMSAFDHASWAVGIDVSADAVAYARREYARPGVQFLQASCDAIPFRDESFGLATAFEVIEHLERWEELLSEARRVLRPEGILLVSTPNKAYYAETRAAAGPNPYHVHEFEYGEFEAALRDVFPHVHLWAQNHSEAITFLPLSCAPGDFDSPGEAAPEQAHFFLAACSRSPIPAARAFAWSAKSGNVLREREHHIVLLEKDLDETVQEKATLQRDHENVLDELRQHNEWAAKLDSELRIARDSMARMQREIEAVHAGYQERVRQLESELAVTHTGYQDRVRQLETEAAERLDWVHDLEGQIAKGRAEIARVAAEIDRLKQENAERTRWAESLDAELERTRDTLTRVDAQLNLAGRSKWVRLGRLLHLGPVITGRDGKPE